MRELPGGNRLKMLIRSFENVNQEIPTRVLRAVYNASMRVREDGAPGFWDARTMLAVYETAPPNTWSESNQARLAAANEATVRNCQMCYGAGMRIIDHPLRPGQTAAVRCDHRPDQEAAQ